MGAGAQALGDGLAQLDATVGLGEGQVLGVGIGDDELDPFKASVDHVVDSVAARAADAEDDDPGLQFRGLRPHQRERHSIPTFSTLPLPPDAKTPPIRIGYERVKDCLFGVNTRLPDSLSRSR